MFSYETGSPTTPDRSWGITVELDAREVEQWRQKDGAKIEEVERYALTQGLTGKKTLYFIKSAGDVLLAHGRIRSLGKKYLDVWLSWPSKQLPQSQAATPSQHPLRTS